MRLSWLIPASPTSDLTDMDPVRVRLRLSARRAIWEGARAQLKRKVASEGTPTPRAIAFYLSETMNKNLRARLKPFLEIAAIAVLALDAVLAVGTIWFSGRMAAEREVHASLRTQVAAQQATVRRLEETRSRLPGTEGQIKLFLENHVPSRREGFARATRLIWLIKEQSGVQLDGVGYKPDRTQDDPLRHLALEVTL